MNVDKLYAHAYDWLIKYGPRFLIGVLVLIVGLWLIRILIGLIKGHMHKKDVEPTVRPFLMSLLSVSLRVLLIIVVMQIMGMQLTLFTALVGAFGVAAGLALSGTLQNFASGVLILLLKPFVIGDNIVTQGTEGTVTSIQIFYTQVKTYDNRILIVPNGQLSNNTIVNLSREGTRRLDINYKFQNAIDIKQAKTVINGIIDKCESVLATPARRVGIVTLAPNPAKQE